MLHYTRSCCHGLNSSVTTSILTMRCHPLNLNTTLFSPPSSLGTSIRWLTAYITGFPFARSRNCFWIFKGATIAMISQLSISSFSSYAELMVRLIWMISTSPRATFCSLVISCLENHNTFLILYLFLLHLAVGAYLFLYIP